MVDNQQIGFEFKAQSAMWTNQSKTDRVSRKYPSPSNLVGVIRSIFDHPHIYPVVTRVDILAVPHCDSYTINGRKNLDIRDNNRTQLLIQPMRNVHYRVFFHWLHLETPTGQDFRKTQEQTWKNLEYLITEVNTDEVERSSSCKAGGKFGSVIDFCPLSEIDPVDISENEVTPFYRLKSGKFYFSRQPVISGSWNIEKETMDKLVETIRADN